MNTKQLEQLDACEDAIEWARSLPDDTTLQQAWDMCDRGDWMLWLLGKTKADRKRLVWAACQCARLALPYAKSDASRICIETTERWTQGEASLDEVKLAANAAANYAAVYTAAAYAAYASADAVAAAVYAAAAARQATLSQCAALVRETFPECPLMDKAAQ